MPTRSAHAATVVAGGVVVIGGSLGVKDPILGILTATYPRGIEQRGELFDEQRGELFDEQSGRWCQLPHPMMRAPTTNKMLLISLAALPEVTVVANIDTPQP
eukprot:COSAG01_NODE_11767_length_1863_cov_1.434807_3_plen_102_part_00